MIRRRSIRMIRTAPSAPRAAQPRPNRGGRARARGHRLHDPAGNPCTGPAHGRPRRRGPDRPRHDRLPSAPSRSPSGAGRRPAGVRDEPRLPPGIAACAAWEASRAPVRPSSRRDVRRIRPAARGTTACPPRTGRPGACQPQPPPASRRLEGGGADHPGRGDHRPAQQDCRQGHRFRYAGAREGEALASPPRSAPRRGRARAHAHRVMTAHAVQVAARARRTREGSPSARHSWGNHRRCAASCAPSMWLPPVAICGGSVTRSASAVTRARPRTGRTQPGRRDVSAPQACVPARPLDGTGLTSREITRTVRHLFTLRDAKLPLQGMQGQPMESVITPKMPVHHHK